MNRRQRRLDELYDVKDLTPHEVVTVGERLVEVSQAGICGGDILVRESESDTWWSITEDVVERIHSDVLQRICGAVLGYELE